MSTTHHTAITDGAAANAATINDPLGELDAAIVINEANIATNEADVLTNAADIATNTAAVATLQEDTGDAIVANIFSTYTIDADAGSRFVLTLTGNVTISFSNFEIGQVAYVSLVQDGIGGHEVVWKTVNWSNGSPPTLDTRINSRSRFQFSGYDGTLVDGDFIGQYTSYFMQDKFLDTVAAGGVDGTATTPISGTRIATDTGSSLSISAGAARVSSPITWGNPRLSYGPYTRAAGLAMGMLVEVSDTTTYKIFGFSRTTTGQPADGAMLFNVGGGIRHDTNGVAGATSGVYVGEVPYRVIVIARGAGELFIIHGGLFWKPRMLWVSNEGSQANLYPALTQFNGDWISEQVDVLNLPGDWATEYGIATDRIASPTSGSIIAMEADGIVEFTWQPIAAEIVDISVRVTDNDNRWIVRVNQAASTIILIERVAGVETSRSSAAQTWTAGTDYRIMIACEGLTISAHVDTTIKVSWAAASTSIDAVAAWSAGATVASDFVSWPVFPDLPLWYDPAYKDVLTCGDSKTADGSYQEALIHSLDGDTSNMWREARIATGGWKVADLKTGIDAGLAVVTISPSHALINIGINDVTTSLPTEAVWKADLTYILTAIHTKFPLATCYIAHIWGRTFAAGCATVNGWIDDVIALTAYAEAGIDEGVYLENGDDGVTYTADGIHPNAAGYVLTADEWRISAGI